MFNSRAWTLPTQEKNSAVLPGSLSYRPLKLFRSRCGHDRAWSSLRLLSSGTTRRSLLRITGRTNGLSTMSMGRRLVFAGVCWCAPLSFIFFKGILVLIRRSEWFHGRYTCWRLGCKVVLQIFTKESDKLYDQLWFRYDVFSLGASLFYGIPYAIWKYLVF